MKKIVLSKKNYVFLQKKEIIMSLKSFLSSKCLSGSLASFGLLVLRVSVCAMMLTHGLHKLSNFAAISQSFNPIGIGGTLSLSLVIFAELFCSIALILGLFTRLASIPLIVAMCVAVFVVHTGHAFAAKEPALLYLLFFTAIFIIGPGRYSVDRLLWK